MDVMIKGYTYLLNKIDGKISVYNKTYFDTLLLIHIVANICFNRKRRRKITKGNRQKKEGKTYIQHTGPWSKIKKNEEKLKISYKTFYCYLYFKFLKIEQLT